MLLPPITTVIVTPAPIATHRSRLIPVSPMSPFHPYNLLPTHLEISVTGLVIMPVIIAIVVRKNNRWKRRWWGQKRRSPDYAEVAVDYPSVDPMPLRLTLNRQCSNNENRRYHRHHFRYALHCHSSPIFKMNTKLLRFLFVYISG